MGNFDYSFAPRVANAFATPYPAYACKTLTVSGLSVDYSLKDNSSLFTILSAPVEFLIKDITQDISIKLNSTDHDAVPIGVGTTFGASPFVTTDIYVTVSGSSTATFTIFAMGWK